MFNRHIAVNLLLIITYGYNQYLSYNKHKRISILAFNKPGCRL